MEMDLKLDQVIKAIDLVRGLSWGAIPLWFALTLPILYMAYSKLLPEKARRQIWMAWWQRKLPRRGERRRDGRSSNNGLAYQEWIRRLSTPISRMELIRGT